MSIQNIIKTIIDMFELYVYVCPSLAGLQPVPLDSQGISGTERTEYTSVRSGFYITIIDARLYLNLLAQRRP